MTDDLKDLLQQLHEPEPPPSISATVMARIAREVEAHAVAEATVPVQRERPAWVWMIVGVTLVAAVALYGPLDSGTLPDFTSARIGRTRPELLPSGGPLMGVLALGLLIYLAGLFAPLRGGVQK
jgi:hypothetical protein